MGNMLKYAGELSNNSKTYIIFRHKNPMNK